MYTISTFVYINLYTYIYVYICIFMHLYNHIYKYILKIQKSLLHKIANYIRTQSIIPCYTLIYVVQFIQLIFG